MCIRWYFIYCHHVVSSQKQHPKGNRLGLCLRTQWDHSSVHPTRSAWVHHCFSPHQSINFHQTHQKLNSKVNFKRLTNKSILLLLFFFHQEQWHHGKCTSTEPDTFPRVLFLPLGRRWGSCQHESISSGNVSSGGSLPVWGVTPCEYSNHS